MNWNRLLAARTSRMTRSAVRELLKLTARPGMISFAGGLPAAELFPIAQCRQVLDSVLQRQGKAALQYGPTEGLDELRDWLVDHLAQKGVRAGRANIVIVSGAQQGLDLLGRVLLEEGDRVVVEDPTYLALLTSWRPMGVRFLPARCDSEGLCLDSVKRRLAEGPKLLYSIPTFQNPSGTTLTVARRRELVRLLQEKSVAIVEDDAYSELRYDDIEPLPSLTALATGERGIEESNAILVGTFSKTLMPGLRVGWVVAPEAVADKIVLAKQSADLHTSTLNQHLAFALVERGLLESHLPVLRAEYRKRRDAMLAALQASPGVGWTWERPSGGMFLMLNLPGGVDGRELLIRALERKVAFVPGEDFHVGGGGQSTIRLNFTHVSPPDIRIGIERLGEEVEQLKQAAPSPTPPRAFVA